MTSIGHAGAESSPQRARRSILQVAVTAIAFLVAALAPAVAQAAPAQARAHVYLMRGVLNVFSLGMDQIAARLQQQGIEASVYNYASWASIADEAAAEYRSGRARNIILVGHSSGATVLPDMVARLSQEGVPVKLAIGLDSVFQTSLSGRVGRYINFYTEAGTRIAQSGNFQGTVENVSVPGVGHITIDKDARIQQKVIAAIDAAAGSASPSPAEAPQAARRPARTATRRAAGYPSYYGTYYGY